MLDCAKPQKLILNMFCCVDAVVSYENIFRLYSVIRFSFLYNVIKFP